MTEIPSKKFPVLILILAASLAFLVNFNFTGAYFNNSDELSQELRSPQDSIYQYRLSNEVPFKYRMLFPEIVLATWQVARDNPYDNGTFITVYRTWCYVFYVTAVLSFFWLLCTVGFTSRQALWAALVFLLLPPMSFAFTFPVHTREDLLGYTLLNMSLIFMIERRNILFLITAIAGAFCRETLLIAPFVFLFFAPGRMMQRMTIAAIPVIAWLGIRSLSGHQQYDMFGMGFWYNLEYLFETCAFFMMSFGPVWLVFVFGISFRKELVPAHVSLFYRSALPALFLVLVSTFLLGRVSEIRLLFLLAPWLIGVALETFIQNGRVISDYIRSSSFLIWSVGSVVALAAIYELVNMFRPRIFLMMTPSWWTILFIQTVLCLWCLPVLYAMYKDRQIEVVAGMSRKSPKLEN